MNKIMLGVTAGVILASCTPEVTTYTIGGHWKDGDGKVIYLKKDLGDKQYQIVDSAVVTNGVFSMQKPLKEVDERILQINGVTHMVILDSIPIQVNCETVRKTVKGREVETVQSVIRGSIEQDIFKTMMEAQRAELLMMLGLAFVKPDEAHPGIQDSIAGMYMMAKARTARTIDSLVGKYTDSYAVALIIDRFVAGQRKLSEVVQMYDRLTPRVKNSYLGQKLKNTIDGLKKTALGSAAPDFTLSAPDGREIVLSSYKGKYVLLDFWASWCGPCLREVPNVKKVYDRYHSRGFEILSVSLDEKKENWVEAIRKYELNWEHVSSLQGWKCPVAKLYNVSGVPAMFLIDKEGKIIAAGLRGEELAEEVAAVYQE